MIRREVVVTTTTSSGNTSISSRWCLTTLPILKWLAVLFCVIIIIIHETSYYGRWRGRYYDSVVEYAFILSIIALVITLLTLVLYFFRIHRKYLTTLPWNTIEKCLDVVLFILFGIAFGMLVWKCVEYYPSQRYDWHRRVAAICAFCGAKALVYLLSAYHAHRYIV